MKAKTPRKTKRTDWLNIRLSAEEAATIEALAKKAIAPSVSDYARNVLLQAPVSIRYYNQSLDNFLADMLAMRNDLNRIGNNFNQAVHRLHTLKKGPEIEHWLVLNEQDKSRLFELIESISIKLNDIYKLWSHV